MREGQFCMGFVDEIKTNYGKTTKKNFKKWDVKAWHAKSNKKIYFDENNQWHDSVFHGICEWKSYIIN